MQHGRTKKAIKARDAGMTPDRDFKTVGDFIVHWRANVLPGEGLAPATVQWYEDMLDAYVIPAVGSRGFTTARGRRALTVGDVETMTANLGARGLSTRVQKGARVVLSKVLHAAQQRELVSRNVARLATAPRDGGRKRVLKALTPAQAAVVLAAVDDTRWHPVVLLGLATGLRPGELLALGWDQVNLDGHEPQLSVQGSLSHVGGASIKAPKRSRSYRTVPIAAAAVPVMRSWRRTQNEERLAAGDQWAVDWDGLVFRTEDGHPVRVDNYRSALRRRLAKAGLPHVSPHAFRHTYATHLIEAGVPIAHVAELLGDTIAIVESTYSHVLRPKHEVTSVVASLLSS